jgi:hypothetical protein
MLTIAIIVLLICNIACLFLLFTMNVLLEKWKKWYWAELDFNYQTQIKWVKHSKNKLKLLKQIGVLFPLEEVWLRNYEKKLYSDYSDQFDHIEDINIIDKLK